MSETSTKFCVLGTMSPGSFPNWCISGDLGGLWILSPQPGWTSCLESLGTHGNRYSGCTSLRTGSWLGGENYARGRVCWHREGAITGGVPRTVPEVLNLSGGLPELMGVTKSDHRGKGVVRGGGWEEGE